MAKTVVRAFFRGETRTKGCGSQEGTRKHGSPATASTTAAGRAEQLAPAFPLHNATSQRHSDTASEGEEGSLYVKFCPIETSCAAACLAMHLHVHPDVASAALESDVLCSQVVPTWKRWRCATEEGVLEHVLRLQQQRGDRAAGNHSTGQRARACAGSPSHPRVCLTRWGPGTAARLCGAEHLPAT